MNNLAFLRTRSILQGKLNRVTGSLPAPAFLP